MESSHDNKDFVLSKKRPKEGVSFGMIPNSIINKLMDKQNRTMRAEGAVMLKRELENAADSENWTLLLPYTGSFIKFLGSLLSDASPKVHIFLKKLFRIWSDIFILFMHISGGISNP